MNLRGVVSDGGDRRNGLAYQPIGSWKFCLDDTGAVSTVLVLKSTGFPAYDQTLEAGMRAWTYKPYVVNDKPVPVCTAVTFIYSP